MNYVQCPHCNAKVKHDGSRDGQTVPCPRCRNPFQFPLLTQSLPAATTANSPSLIFSDAAEPSYGINAREPWFYGFLEVYAKVSMWLGTLTAFGLFFHVFIHVLTFMGSPAEFSLPGKDCRSSFWSLSPAR